MAKGKAKRSQKDVLSPTDDLSRISLELQRTELKPNTTVSIEPTACADQPHLGTDGNSHHGQPLQHPSHEMQAISYVEVKATESKGQAIFATRKIKPGTLILRESPLIRLTQAEEDIDKASENETSIVDNRFKELPRASQKAYFKLFDSEKSDYSRVKSIYYSNCYNLSNANRPCKTSPGGSAIGLLASRVNHSCLPNVQFSFDEATNEMLFHAIKPIPRGKEIVSNYNSIFELRAARQRKQMLYYGFRCDCEACEVRTDFWARSDERRRGMIDARREIRGCEKVFGETSVLSSDNDPNNALVRLESLMVKEGIVGLPLADTYRSLSKWAERKGDQKGAKLWKVKELEVCKICFGQQSARVHHVNAKLDKLT